MDYDNFMNSTGYVGLIIFALFILIGVTLPIIRERRRRMKFSGGIQVDSRRGRYYEAEPTAARIGEILSEKSEGDLLVYSYADEPLNAKGERELIFYKRRKSLYGYRPERYLISFSGVGEATLIYLRPEFSDKIGRCDAYIDQFLVEKLNCRRVKSN